MTPRVHIHLKTADLQASRGFYRKFLGVEPVKDKPDHVKFVMPFAPLNLVISPARIPPAKGRTVVNHLGIEVSSGAAVEQHLQRVKQEGLKVREQLNINCCYANQSKFWVIDPDGVEWEIYHVNYDLIEKHGGGIEAPKPGISTRITGEVVSGRGSLARTSPVRCECIPAVAASAVPTR
jgi:catechol 2,3-dioxygenase-like lactoylglutathione lyase family enzyme